MKEQKKEVTVLKRVPFDGEFSAYGNPVFIYDDVYLGITFGKVLSLFEAFGMMPDDAKSKQREAIKQLVRDAIWHDPELNWCDMLNVEEYAALKNWPPEQANSYVNK